MIGLADVLEQLRIQLEEARRRASGADLHFELGPVELEVSVALTKEAGPSGKLRFWVLELGTDAKIGSATIQKIKLSITPRLTVAASAHGPVLSREAVEIAGQTQPGEG